MTMEWYEALAFDASEAVERKSSTVVVVPIGTFDTSGVSHLPDKLTISRKLATELAANFRKGVMKTKPFVDDGGHNEDKASGWFTRLWVGTFPHAATGQPMPGLLADVEWTSLGQQLLADMQYRYLSAVIAKYKDEENGKEYNVLRSATLTNKPVMKMMPEVTLAGASAVVTTYTASADGVNTSPVYNWSDWTMPDVAELTFSELNQPVVSTMDAEPVEETPEKADPLIALAAAFQAVEPLAKGDKGIRSVRVLRTEVLARLDSILQREEVNGMAKLYDNEGNEVALAELPEVVTLRETAQRAEAAEAKLAEIQAEKRTADIASVLDAASEKGMTEPAREALKAILTAKDGEVRLSEDSGTTDILGAMRDFVAKLELVPVAPVASQPASTEPDVSPEREAIRKQLRIN